MVCSLPTAQHFIEDHRNQNHWKVLRQQEKNVVSFPSAFKKTIPNSRGRRKNRQCKVEKEKKGTKMQSSLFPLDSQEKQK